MDDASGHLCRTCGKRLVKIAASGRWPEWCSDECRKTTSRRARGTCSEAGCESPVSSRDLCNAHYLQARKIHAAEWAQERARRRAARIAAQVGAASPGRSVCAEPGCNDLARSRGLCAMHYKRAKREQGEAWGSRVERSTCSHPGCTDLGGSRSGLCGPHWRAANRDKAAEATRRHFAKVKYDEEVRARRAAYGRAYRAAHLDDQRQRDRNMAGYERRRAQKLNAICEHGLTCVKPSFRRSLRLLLCYYCGAPSEHADHYIPLAGDGLHCRFNLVPACARCNISKNDSLPDEWLEHRAQRK
jgi:5-methylcytosine-specific restriction endonuclease McrA